MSTVIRVKRRLNENIDEKIVLKRQKIDEKSAILKFTGTIENVSS